MCARRELITPIKLSYLERITISRDYVFGGLKVEVVVCD
jgi:hypothetical protein